MGKHIRFDWAIKRLLRQKANFVVLEGFLSELLKQDITINEILESAGNKDSEDDKFNVVDILVKNSKDELMLIEVQNERENDFFHRMNYGQAKLISEHIWEGDDYGSIKKVISINIVYFDLGHGTDYVYVGGTSFRGMHHNDLLELNASQKKAYPIDKVCDVFTTYYLLKVNNFDNVAKDTLDEWVYFLKNSTIPDNFNAKGLAEAKNRLRVDDMSDEEKIAYDKFLKAKRIQQNVHESAIAEGLMKAQEAIAQERMLKEAAEAREIEERKQKEAAEAREIEERKQKEDANKVIQTAILNLSQKGMSALQIASILEVALTEVEQALGALGSGISQ